LAFARGKLSSFKQTGKFVTRKKGIFPLFVSMRLAIGGTRLIQQTSKKSCKMDSYA
jgi:hypothetical protein